VQITLSKFNPLEYHQFDAALEAVMLEEEKQFTKSTSLASHPVYGLLLDTADQLMIATNAHGVKMTTPVTHTPEVNIVTRIKAIGGYFNPELLTEQWQAAADHHPAAPFIQEELQAALQASVSAQGDWNLVELAKIMDRLDDIGYQTAFDRSTMIFSILFKEHADIRMADTQQDLKNKRLLDEVNGVDAEHNPDGGWHDDKPVFTRQHPWKIQLKDPRPPVLRRQHTEMADAHPFQFRDVIVAKPSFPRRSD
jgi:hypothetical protein